VNDTGEKEEEKRIKLVRLKDEEKSLNKQKGNVIKLSKNKFTVKQERFCQEYIIDLNATQAAERTGYSKKTAYSQGQRLLKNVEIQARIQELMKERSERTEINQDMVIKELAKLGFSTMNDFATWGKTGVALIESLELTPDQAACVSEVSETVTKDGGTVRFKLHDKKGSLELLGKHLGMFKEQLEHSGEIIFREFDQPNIPDNAGK